MAKYKSVEGKLRKGGGKGLSGDALVGRVSQSTIDDIKRMGMTKALRLAGKNGATAGGLAREFQEGVRRMYGAKRLADAKSKYAPKTKKSGMSPNAADRKTPVKPAAKPAAKNNTKSNILKTTAGAAAAVGILALTKGKGIGAASKMAPGLTKSISKSSIGKALIGKQPKLSPAMLKQAKAIAAKQPKYATKVTIGPKGSFGKTTAQLAKSGKGTPSEYALKAGQDSARAAIRAKGQGAARSAASYPKTIKSGKSTKTFGEISKNVTKKAPTKMSLKKKAALATTGAGGTTKTKKK